MTLRARLTAAFLAIVFVPLVLGGILVARSVPQVQAKRTATALDDSKLTVTLALADLCHLSTRSSEVLALRASRLPGFHAPAGKAATSLTPNGRAAAQALASSMVRGATPDVALLQNSRGATVASAGALPAGLASRLPRTGRCTLTVHAGSAVLGSSVDLQRPGGADAGRAWFGYAITDAFARDLMGHRSTGSASPTAGKQIGLTFVAGSRVLASTLSPDLAQRAAKRSSPPPSDGRQLLTVRSPAQAPVAFVVSAELSRPTGDYLIIAGILLAALVAGIAVAFRLAHAITFPLGAIGEAAERVAAGDLDTRVPFRSRDEIGRFAESFNTMTSELRSYVGALRASRDQLRRNLSLLGDTLSSTHDLNRILTVITDTAMTASGARAGAVFLAGPTDLRCQTCRGFDPATEQQLAALRLHPGEGIVGRVAATGEPQLGRPSEGAVDPSREPYDRAYIAVPIKSTGRLLGVLLLTDRLGGDDFTDADLETLRSFASHAAVAIENVLLHEEAQRLSLTDGLTGLWNYRYFQMTLAKEVERASRFDRPLALLMLDIDRFKEVNDTHGHQCGDAVLVELAQRVSAVIREVDVLVRYGGEEIMLVLPETDETGAERTADRICEVVRAVPVAVPGTAGIPITVSVGIAVFPQHGMTVSTLVESADDALYAAKSAGRDTWRMAESNGSVPV